MLISGEKDETVTVIAYFNAEEVFLPSVSIFRGENKKQGFEDGMPPGAQLYMGVKSAYANAKLFLKWLETTHLSEYKRKRTLRLVDFIKI